MTKNARKAINQALPIILGCGAVACFLARQPEAGTALLAVVAAHLTPSPIGKDGEP